MKNVNMSLPKVSVIVPVYNTGRFLERCVSSIISQTYENLEIILVNDASSDDSLKIMEDFATTDARVRVISHPKNLGLFTARLTGVRKSTGEYISFVDSDDCINEDFIRCLVQRAVSGGFDIVMGDTVHEDVDGRRWVHAGYNGAFIPDRFGEDVLKNYLRQEGYCFLWHAVWNKIYKRRLFDLGMPFFESIDEHLIMGEDILFSSVLHYYAKSFSKVDFAYYFYIQHSEASTSLRGGVSRFSKSISDIASVFSSVEGFFREKKISWEGAEHFRRWRELYSRFWCDNIKNSSLSPRDKRRMLEKLKNVFELSCVEGARQGDNWFYSRPVPFDSRYIDLVSKIRKYDTVSFDLFDTVLVRKCYKPTDAFYFLDARLRRYFKKNGVFHDVRVLAERMVRSASVEGEVTLDDIYDYIGREHGLGAHDLEEIKQAELKCEWELLDTRKSVVNLIELSRQLGKEVIITSDFYMGREILEKMLLKKGVHYDKLLVSCDFGKTKSDGGLFSVLRDNAVSSKIIHIGDNWHSDYEMCRSAGIDAHFYPSVISCFMNEITDIHSSPSANVYTEPTGQWISYEHSLKFFEVRCALALSAKEIYDNPYISYLRGSAFNCSGRFIGYYALGMHLFGVARWLYESNLGRCGRLHFIARDGYLPRLAYDIMNDDGAAAPSGYLYSSRKALLPLLYLQAESVEELLPLVRGASKRQLDKWLSLILDECKTDDDTESKKSLSDEKIYEYVKYNLQKRLSKNKIADYLEKIKKHFSNIVSDGDAFFDIGYSGRPISAFSELLGKEISGFFIHRTSDQYIPHQRASNIKIDCFYDYTPAICGSIREMLFSSQEPSCIGYYTGGDVRPIFEEQRGSFAERYAIDEAQREALRFVTDMKQLYLMSPELFSARPIDISAPYEYLLSCKNYYDASYFSAIRFEDDVYHGKSEMMLLDVWQGAQDYHRVLEMRSAGRRSFDDGLDRSVGEMLLYRTKLERALFFLIFDRRLFFKKLKRNLFGRRTK